MKKAVVSPAAATPKLMDICCAVLAMELALLVSASMISAYTRVFHARILQRLEGSVAEGLQHDDPDRRGESDGRKTASAADPG